MFSRTAATALVEQLRVELLTEPSATRTLEHWCDTHRLAAQPLIRAELQKGLQPELSPAERAKLKIGPTEPVRYRHVLLTCGDRVLSDAENWYVPARLTTAMNQLLDTTDTPFGKVVAPLAFQRHTVSSILLWSPLPTGWPATPVIVVGRNLAIPERLFENQAILTRGGDGLPFALVVETYRSEVLPRDLPRGQ